MPSGTVEVFLIGAVGIKDTELFGKADPYAVMFCGKQKLRSNTASNQGSKPLWNQKFSFYIDDSTTNLQIKVYNHNILTEDDELGSTIIPLARVFAEGKLPTTSYNVVRPSGRVQGEVKLSIAFTPKHKPGQQPAQNVPGPYNAKTHGSPYAATPPEPKVKHDPLIGPHGYFKNNSSTSPLTGSSHGSSRPYPPSGVDTYPPSQYPPVPPVNAPYPRTDSNPSYQSTDSFSSQASSSHGRLYPNAPPTSASYAGSVYHQSPYGQSSRPSSHHSDANHPHGAVPMSSAPTAYPPPGGLKPSYSSVPSTKPSYGGGNHGGADQYRFDELAGNFGALNVSDSDSDSSSHGRYPGYQSTQSFSNNRPPPPSGYPPTESSSHYPAYRPPSNDGPGSGYPPTESSSHYPAYKPPSSDGPGSGYPTPGYPSGGNAAEFESNHGNFSHPGSYSLYGYQAPPSSYYPPLLGVPQQPGHPEAGNPQSANAYPPPSNAYPPSPNAYPPAPNAGGYPPVPYYNAPSAHYVPAGYPK